MSVRTRFAPSPTGYLHIGGARTALFCWLYTRRMGGTFILRIEDTDRERSTDAHVQVIHEAMNWLGLRADEGPYYQTQRFDRYNEVIDELLASGKAYRCYCSRERLDELRQQQQAAGLKPRYDGRCRDLADTGQTHVIRFRNPDDGQVVFEDAVHGTTAFDNTELDDLIIRRSDGTPTYNLSVVVDDVDMEITHVIRGDDHLNNTPRQANIYHAMGATLPVFAHLPMILGADGARLSKRHGSVSVLEYREEGYLPEALLNYLVRLGWSHGDQEIFGLNEMISLFDLADVNKAPSKFNPEKLLWLNQHHIKDGDPARLGELLGEHLRRLGVEPAAEPALPDVVRAQQERARTMVEMAMASEFFYRDVTEYNEKAAKKHLKQAAREPLKQVRASLADLTAWQTDDIHAVIDQVAQALELKMGKVAQPVRVAVSGGPISPPIDITLRLLGRRRTLERLDRAVRFIDDRAGPASD
ncbi:MAG: glutamate--tRNA ligase [Gammaproteobacteria bacterium]|nr:glutamate--tRNA ligase [Gammaproteobacteria bacterium]NNM20057.1 glutamate--tRNA ligase [Gammaproteobacteria bacterium]